MDATADQNGGGNSSRVKLLSDKLSVKRRRGKQPSKESFTSNEEVPRGRSTLNHKDSYEDDNGDMDDGDSQSDMRHSRRASFSDQDGDGDSDDDSLARSSSRPAINLPSEHSSEAQAQDSGSRKLSRTSTLASLRPNSSSSDRQPSRSPASRFKNAFRSKKNVAAADPEIPELPFSDSNLPARLDADSASSERPLRSRGSVPAIGTSAPPATPPSVIDAAPVIVNTPPTPTESRRSEDRQFNPRNNNIVVSPSGRMISHRRVRSTSSASGNIGPSKLSQSIHAPLTPTPENAVAPSTPSFFSSVFSVAQNAANTFITTNGTRPGSSGQTSLPPLESQTSEASNQATEPASASSTAVDMGDKELAVKTLGSGDLSLDQLGIPETASPAPTPSSSRFPEDSTAGPDALTGVDGQSDPGDAVRPRSLREPDLSEIDPKTGISRTGSIRSAIGRRRKRGSTSGTGGTTGTGMTIGAAIASANTNIAQPTAGAQKLTGFAVASKKRNREFHNLFKSVPDDDYLIEDYSCALQREILAHGRLYVSEGHLCFSSNIFGWQTTLVMSFDEIVSVEKKSTALVFKNGLIITTLHAKHIFASFTSRDSTYDLIVNIWKLGHPNLRSMLNGVSLGDETNGDRTEKVDAGDGPAGLRSASASDEEESEDGQDVYDEDEDDSIHEGAGVGDVSSGEADPDKAIARKISGAMTSAGTADKPDSVPAPTSATDFPGPATHAPTDCGDSDSHYDVVVGDDIIPAPLGKVYDLMFGPASVQWMSKWLTVEQKCTDLQMEDKKGLIPDNKTRMYTYIKPLYASIGPKQTKCITTEVLDSCDLEKSVNVLVTTQTPDVPSGNVFSVKTRYCLSWAENNATHVHINCTIEWTGKSWIKGPIEKGAKDGQGQYAKDIFASLKAAVSSRPASAPNGAGGGRKGKKKGKGKMRQASQENLDGAADLSSSKSSDWGLFEPLHGILGPIFDILQPIFTGNVVYGLLVGLLVSSFFGFGLRPAPGYANPGVGFMGHPERLAAYEQMWRREESDLWDWLEERVGIHRMGEDSNSLPRKRAMDPRSAADKVREERVNERELEEAIRVTEEKLQVLRGVMNKKQASGPSNEKAREAPADPSSAEA